MMDSKIFMDKINEIEKRMAYVIYNWESDSQITHQEIRFTIVAYLYGLYRNKKVKDLAKVYLQRIDEKSRLGFEIYLTAIAAALVVHKDFSDYWSRLKKIMNKSSNTDKYNLKIQFLTILTPDALKRIEDEIYIKALLEELKNQDTEKKLFSYWTEKRLFSKREEITISQDQIKNLKEYLLWEVADLEKYEHKKEGLREKFIPEMLDYKVDRIDWIVLLAYQFFKKNKTYIITESELNRKIREGVRSKINKKVLFPVVSSILFLILKLWKENIITRETLGQIALLIVGIILLVFEESLPTMNINKKKITSVLPAVVLIIGVLLWNFGISWVINLIINLIISIIVGIIIPLSTE